MNYKELHMELAELRDLNRHYLSSITVLNEQLEAMTKERNKYRSQAIMRANKIEEILNGQELKAR